MKLDVSPLKGPKHWWRSAVQKAGHQIRAPGYANVMAIHIAEIQNRRMGASFMPGKSVAAIREVGESLLRHAGSLSARLRLSALRMSESPRYPRACSAIREILSSSVISFAESRFLQIFPTNTYIMWLCGVAIKFIGTGRRRAQSELLQRGSPPNTDCAPGLVTGLERLALLASVSASCAKIMDATRLQIHYALRLQSQLPYVSGRGPATLRFQAQRSMRPDLRQKSASNGSAESCRVSGRHIP